MAHPLQDERLPDLAGLRILVAEDNISNQIVAGEMLRAMGAVVEIAGDGAEAMEMLSDRVYDALIVDIEMPRISGIDVIRAVRGSEEPLASRPILALTAYSQEDHGARIMAAGADAVLEKPIESVAALGRAVLAPMREGGRAGARARADRTAAGAAGAGTGAGAGIDAGADAGADAALAALERSVGPEMMGQLLGKMIDDITAARDRIAAAALLGDMPALRAATHVLTAVSGMAGADALSRQAAALNERARAARPEGHPDARPGDRPEGLSEAAASVIREANAALDRLRLARERRAA